jgi:putative hemolysin
VQLLIVLLLIGLNGLLVLSEMSIVASSRARLQHWADEGRAGAGAALALATEPAHLLSTTQLGITIVGIVSGAFAAETVAKQLAGSLAESVLLQPYADTLALMVVVTAITVCSLVFGELVPKRLALRHPEAIASAVARPMQVLARVTFPLVKAMSLATDAVLRPFGRATERPQSVSEEEIRVLMRQGADAGVFDRNEQAMVTRVFRMDEQRVTSVMTPRVDIHFLDVDASFYFNRDVLLESPHSRYPLGRGGLDTIVGIVAAKGLLDDALQDKPFDLALHAGTALFIPDGLTITGVLDSFKKHHARLALVVDEYGEIQGLVTMADVMEALVGDIGTAEQAVDADIVRRGDGSWRVDGAVTMQRLGEAIGLGATAAGGDSVYNTLGGFAMAHLRRMPRPGDSFESGGFRFEVLDVDSHRVDKLLVTPVAGRGSG